MRVLVLLFLATVVSTELCHVKGKKAAEDRKTLQEIKALARAGAQLIVGESCPFLANNIEKVLFDKKCRALAKQSVCYGKRVAERYSDQFTAVSYGQLASGVDQLAELGNLACDDGAACYKQISRVINKCMKKNKNFVDQTIAAAEFAYRANAQASVEEFVNDRSETLFGEVAKLVMDRFTSVSDIEDFLNEILNQKSKTKIQSDAALAAGEIKKVARGFCNSGCFNESASFIKSLFEAMHGDQCLDATQFCGSCKDNAHDYLESSGLMIPCCLNNVIQKGIEAYDYIGEQYGEKIREVSDMISAQLSEKALQRAEEIRDELSTQADCIEEFYNDHQPRCKAKKGGKRASA